MSRFRRTGATPAALLACLLLTAACARPGSDRIHDGRRSLSGTFAVPETAVRAVGADMPAPTAAPDKTANPASGAKPAPDPDAGLTPDEWIRTVAETKYPGGEYGLVIVDLTTGARYVRAPDEPFIAASTIKLPMAMYTYDMAAAGQIDLNTALAYDAAEDYEDGSGILKDKLKHGETRAIGTLLDLAVIESDNIAANMIFRFWREQPDGLTLGERLNANFHLHYDADTLVTAGEMAGVLIELYENRAGNPYYPHLMHNLKHTTFNTYVTRSLPSGAVAHKYGVYGGDCGDVGILEGPRPFAFAVYGHESDAVLKLMDTLGQYLYTRATAG